MTSYMRKINYYETDKMGITHHSNYIRFMEEARLFFLEQIGYPMTRMESEGIVSPVVSVSCDYKRTTTYADELAIDVSLKEYTGARLVLAYEMRLASTGDIVCNAQSTHCFTGKEGRPVSIRRQMPEFHTILSQMNK